MLFHYLILSLLLILPVFFLISVIGMFSGPASKIPASLFLILCNWLHFLRVLRIFLMEAAKYTKSITETRGTKTCKTIRIILSEYPLVDCLDTEVFPNERLDVRVGKPVTFRVEVVFWVISVDFVVATVGVVFLSQRFLLWLNAHTFSDAAPNLDLHSSSTLSLPSPQHFEHGKQKPLSSK